MKFKKFIIFFSLSTSYFSFISLCLSMEKINLSLSIDRNYRNDKITFFGGSSSDDKNEKEPTEDEIREAKKLFWIEFGVTTGFLILVIACVISFIIIKKKKK